MDIDELLKWYDMIPPRQPRGSPQNLIRGSRINWFKYEAKKQGLSYVEALKLCREKRENAAISPST